ncbi:MAG: hypothetical protein K0Q73_6427 [Paenibacillus sp.]|nr:hypothetical protein [Paenibacillus sp.]
MNLYLGHEELTENILIDSKSHDLKFDTTSPSGYTEIIHDSIKQ